MVKLPQDGLSFCVRKPCPPYSTAHFFERNEDNERIHAVLNVRGIQTQNNCSGCLAKSSESDGQETGA